MSNVAKQLAAVEEIKADAKRNFEKMQESVVERQLEVNRCKDKCKCLQKLLHRANKEADRAVEKAIIKSRKAGYSYGLRVGGEILAKPYMLSQELSNAKDALKEAEESLRKAKDELKEAKRWLHIS